MYANGVNVPELMVTSTATYRLVKDHLGSVRRAVDVSSGVVLQAIEYDAWGRVLSDSNPGAQPFGFAGGLYDADTGLVRFGAREYSGEVGRWVSKDSARFDGGENFFVYANDDPVNFIDPEGLQAREAAAGAVAGLGLGEAIGWGVVGAIAPAAAYSTAFVLLCGVLVQGDTKLQQSPYRGEWCLRTPDSPTTPADPNGFPNWCGYRCPNGTSERLITYTACPPTIRQP